MAVKRKKKYLVRNLRTPRQRQVSETGAFEKGREETGIRHEATRAEIKLQQRRVAPGGQLQEGRVAQDLLYQAHIHTRTSRGAGRM